MPRFHRRHHNNHTSPQYQLHNRSTRRPYQQTPTKLNRNTQSLHYLHDTKRHNHHQAQNTRDHRPATIQNSRLNKDNMPTIPHSANDTVDLTQAMPTNYQSTKRRTRQLPAKLPIRRRRPRNPHILPHNTTAIPQQKRRLRHRPANPSPYNPYPSLPIHPHDNRHPDNQVTTTANYTPNTQYTIDRHPQHVRPIRHRDTRLEYNPQLHPTCHKAVLSCLLSVRQIGRCFG